MELQNVPTVHKMITTAIIHYHVEVPLKNGKQTVGLHKAILNFSWYLERCTSDHQNYIHEQERDGISTTSTLVTKFRGRWLQIISVVIIIRCSKSNFFFYRCQKELMKFPLLSFASFMRYVWLLLSCFYKHYLFLRLQTLVLPLSSYLPHWTGTHASGPDQPYLQGA